MAEALQPDGHEHAPTHEHEHEHPSTRIYWLIGVILGVITAVEVAIFYIEALAPVILPLLLVLSAGKFVLVVMFYMHLKMDSRIFTGVFVAPMTLAIFLIVALIVLFRVLPAFD